MSKEFEEQAIRYLRGEENPFDAFVVPDKPAHEFPQFHVQEVHGDQFEQIVRVIDKYRFPDYRTRRQLHETRAVVVRGLRGNGKTHLLHVLRQRETAAPEIWVCPRHFDPAFPFSEYLLTELVGELLSSEDVESPVRLRWCARELTRRMLVEAVASLDLPQWQQWSRVRSKTLVPWHRAASRLADWQRLLEDLLAGPGTSSLPDICLRCGLSPSAALGLVWRHIEHSELGTGTAVRMRREVLLGFAELALREVDRFRPSHTAGARQPRAGSEHPFPDATDRLASLLEQDFAQADITLPPARAQWVTMLLQTLAEVLAAIGVPIIFAMDNMERLLSPRGPVDMPAARSFFSGLAHCLDQTRGLLVVLFVESGQWSDFRAARDSFSDHRLMQGVRIADYGCVWELELKPPTADQIEQVVRRRMSPLLARAPGGDQLAPCFPFQREEVRQMASAGTDPLRTALLRLRDRYDQLVLPDQQGQRAAMQFDEARSAPPRDQEETVQLLRRSWDQAADRARQRLAASQRTSLTPTLHAGLGRWLELLEGQEVGPWRLSEVRSAVTFGDHPTFGSVTLAVWETADNRTCRVAIGPLLGQGRAMPKDLEIKLSSLRQRPPLADQLVVLWPTQDEAKDAAQLPPATRQIWEQAAATQHVWLCSLTLSELARLLSLSEWLTQEAVIASSPESLRNFLQEQTSYLLTDLAPRQPLPDPSDQPPTDHGPN